MGFVTERIQNRANEAARLLKMLGLLFWNRSEAAKLLKVNKLDDESRQLIEKLVY